VAKTSSGLFAVAVMTGISVLTPAASARDQLRIVGSSTVYPFTAAVAEQFGKATSAKTPVIESTGTGGGMKIFCEGIGVDKADVTNASRRIKKGEFEACQKNGVSEIIEVNIGFDGLTIAQSKTGAPMKLTLAQVFLALAEQVPAADGKLVANPHKVWSDIDPALPNVRIEVLGPPPTSGTRDSLHELFLEKGAEQIPALKALKSADPKAFEKTWKSIRRDGAYVEAGENDNVIVQKLEINKDALGVFGYSFLEENAAKLRGVDLEAAEPTFENIASGKYKGARRMYVYFKKQHFGVIPGLDKFLAQYVSEKTLGQDGTLARKGLVSLPKAELEAVRKSALAGETMKLDALTN
jgi:phosphate transport system substrate-binding protein